MAKEITFDHQERSALAEMSQHPDPYIQQLADVVLRIMNHLEVATLVPVEVPTTALPERSCVNKFGMLEMEEAAEAILKELNGEWDKVLNFAKLYASPNWRVVRGIVQLALRGWLEAVCEDKLSFRVSEGFVKRINEDAKGA